MERYKLPKAASPEDISEEVLAERGVQEFIRAREIRPESYPLLVALAQIPKDTIINGMHNFFSFYKGPQALSALTRSATNATDKQQKQMYELFRTFTEHYDEYVSRHLVAVLERR